MKDFYVPDLRELLDNAAEKFGDRAFIKYIEDGEIKEKSYIEVRDDSLAVCRRLIYDSVCNKHIAIAGKTSYSFIIYFFGILLSGNVAVPFSPDISTADAVNLFDYADIDIVMYDDYFAADTDKIGVALPRIWKFINTSDKEIFQRITKDFSSDSKYANLADFKVDKNKCALIIYTSGTTGKRKGVMLSTNSLISNLMYTDYCEALGEGNVALSVLPMHHIYCFSGDCVRNLIDGVTVCLNDDLRNLNSNLAKFQPSVMRIVPMIAQSLLQRIRVLTGRKNNPLTLEEAKEKVFGKNIRWLISGGAYLNPELVEEYDRLGIYLRQGYGMTEAGCRISVPDETVSNESVGRVIDICDIRTQNGEIQVKTPSVMLGYYKMPEETKKIFTIDGWLRTGDIGYVTEDRQLFITGRLKNLIILSGGENVSPEAIEKKFAPIHEVSEVQIYAENDRIIAEIFPDDEFCALQGIKDIKSVISEKIKKMNNTAKASHIISELRLRDVPFERTANGKIKRKETVVSK